MAPPQFKVIIAGGGIAGLALGVMLERAGIDYLILEAEKEVRPLGAVVCLGPPVLRAFEQLGLLEDMVRESNIMTGVTVMDYELNKVCRINTDYTKERYGYDTLSIVRPKLHGILLSRIPAYKILFGKRVVSTTQSSEGIKVRCKDESTYSGDILVASDGGASPIRTAIHEEIRRRSKKTLHPADYEQPKLNQRCIVGVTQPMSTKQFPILASKECELILVMPKQTNCVIWFVPMTEKRFGWGITSPMPVTPAAPPQSGRKTMDGGDSGFDVPSSPASVNNMTRSFSAMSTTSYSPPSTASSSPIQASYSESGDYMTAFHGHSYSGQNYSSGGSGGPNTSGAQPSHSVKKRQSLSRLSKHSSNSAGSQWKFQQYPAVLQLTESTTLDMKELPSDPAWGNLDERYTIEDSIREQESPYGGTLGDIIDATSKKMISMVVIDEKFYHTWHFGRTVLLGDSCHKILPSAGHGTTQSILDSISLASLLADLPSNSITDIDALFRVQYERRAPSAKAAVVSSQQQEQLLFNRNLTGKVMRKIASSFISEWLNVKLADRVFESRPMLTFLKAVPDRGSAKNKDKTVPLLEDKRYEAARRKSISSGYLNAMPLRRKGRSSSEGGDGLGLPVVDMEFETGEFAASMPSIVRAMPPAVPPLPTIMRPAVLTAGADGRPLR
ncbi:hypothetical protein BGZ99_000532 [Dissophora globulifera]|uniref:FAD-binding domain-containing protein n=1 Tax=Dissophora globulifera TaxID=979702 RepID=A0A9P6UXB5_9FUNG|nr:hypothetical protein BGZ99_000532 [Dissophora globulifera]